MEKKYSGWSAICRSKELKKSIFPFEVQGIPMIAFRNKDGEASVLLDACCHRQAPLSKGKVINGLIQCPYHGWEFDQKGICHKIPGSNSDKSCSRYRVKHFPTIEQDSIIWVWVADKKLEDEKPLSLPFFRDNRFSHLLWTECIEANIENIIENLLDPMHTHYVHAGVIRKNGNRENITATIRKKESSVEVEYQGEERQSGLISKLFFKSSEPMKMYGRFFLSSIAQLEYYVRDNKRFFLTVLLRPIDIRTTNAIIINTFNWNIPHFLIKLIAKPIFRIALKQDINILKMQQKNIDKLGNYAKNHDSELDLIAPSVKQLLARPFDKHIPHTKKVRIYL